MFIVKTYHPTTWCCSKKFRVLLLVLLWTYPLTTNYGTRICVVKKCCAIPAPRQEWETKTRVGNKTPEPIAACLERCRPIKHQ